MALKGDFIGFTFNGIHSSDMGIVHVSNGSRYQENLLPSFKERTQEVPGGDGTYYFGSEYTQRQFNVDFATDELSETQFRQLRQWLGDRGIHELVFDECPYKVWSAKCTGTPNFNFICFKEGEGNRTYKGEGQITFVAYFPFARSAFKVLPSVGEIANVSEWSATSGILSEDPTTTAAATSFNVYNPGDMPANFKFFVPAASGSVYVQMNGGEALKLDNVVLASGDSGICIDSQTNLIQGYTTVAGPTVDYELSTHLYNKYKTAGVFFKIPVCTVSESSLMNKFTSNVSGYLRYDYLYL